MSNLKSTCIACTSGGLRPLFATPLLPVSNDYRPSELVRARFSLEFAVCNNCELLQLVTLVSPDIVRPSDSSVLYNEPESHLDEVVEDLRQLPDLTPDSLFVGLSYKEDSTFERLRRIGFDQTYRLQPATDYRIEYPTAGLETIQQAVCSLNFSAAMAQRGQAQVIVARHVLEHAHSPLLFLESLQRHIEPRGYLVVEVPDCSRALSLCDYTMVWEEHISYFTPRSLANIFLKAGLEVVSLKIYPQPYEDSIVAIVRKSPGTDVAAPVQVDISQACLFASQFPAQKAAVHSFIKEHAAGGVLLFGAGHLATTFVHMHEIQDFIEYAVDDQPEKAGKVLPGTRIPIEPSSRLGSTQAALCLLALNPANEERVVTRFAEFAARGGRFMSLFPVSSRRLPVIGTCL